MKLSYILLPLSLLVSSLDSYFRERGVVSLIFLAILVIINRRVIINYKHMRLIFFVFTIFIVYTFLSFFIPSVYLEIGIDKENFSFKIVDRLSIVMLLLFISITYGRNDLIRSVIIVANIHVVLFIIQFILYYVASYPVDYLKLFGDGIAQRNWMGFDGNNVFRASGLYFEPSNYAAYMSLYIAILVMLKYDISGYKYIYPVSMMLTLSSAGFIMGAISFLAVILTKNLYLSKLKKILLILFLIIWVGLLGIPQINRFSESGIENNANSNLRIMLITSVIDSASSSILKTILGTGIYSYSKKIYEKENSVAGREVASVQDASMIVYFFMSFGFLGIVLIWWVFLSVSSFGGKLAIFSVLLSKISFLFPIFPFLLVALIISKSSSFDVRGINYT
ncbi:hypothetical protein [Aeromonas veronii]|uniref:hypothetical protein n=1 Tax=Aeromonas veronii TaxID=654 RepID=UPI003D19C519